MSLQNDIVIRYRDDGHVRFELPAILCKPDVAPRLIAGLKRVEGVYRVDFSPKQRKLSVRYMGTVVDFIGLARNLSAIVDEVQSESNPAPHLPAELLHWRQELGNARPIRWLKEKFEELKETAAAAAILARAGKRKPAASLLTEDVAVDFLIDILVLYLIKTHWRLILNDWMRRPWQYKSEWLATFYMIFLLMRSRMPKSN